jgi:hypothetical protein
VSAITARTQNASHHLSGNLNLRRRLHNQYPTPTYAVELLAYALAQAPGKEILMIETKISASFYGHIRQYHS